MFGDPSVEIPGSNIIFPKDGSYLRHKEVHLKDLRKSYLKRYKDTKLTKEDLQYLSEELRINVNDIIELL